MTEKEIERRLRDLIKQRGGLTHKFISPNAPGVPDRIVIARGKVWFVELKTCTNKCSKIQDYRINELKKHGANVRIVYGYDQMLAFVNEVLPNGV